MHVRLLVLSLAAFLVACPSTPKIETGTPDTGTPPADDVDADGYDTTRDCDDTNPEVHPDAAEACNGLDDDCDGATDEDVLTSFYADADADGYGDDATATGACETPEGHVPVGGDCDDANAEVFPGAPERCNDRDDDCDGTTDEDLVATWYADGDGDGFGDAASTLTSCDPGPGWVSVATDCDDSDASAWPGAPEICDGVDNDCDGAADEDLLSTWYADADGDGWGDATSPADRCEPGGGWSEVSGDCDDHNSAIHPEAEEVCDVLDNDCDGLVDDADSSVSGTVAWYADADADGYGDDAVLSTACAAPAGYVAVGGDCDDTDPAFNPGAAETDCADPTDYNCDGSTGWTDDDGDGWAACQECDDGSPTIFPGAEEACDLTDNDCDGEIDEAGATGSVPFFLDADADGHGDPATSTSACTAPTGYVATGDDCDDVEPTIFPGAAEDCDGLDDDCDGTIDEGTLTTWYADADADGFGDPAAPTEACEAPAGSVSDATDCDDTLASVNPGAAETCDGLDDDCDGATDEAGADGATAWYPDTDADGWGDPTRPTLDCVAPAGFVADGTDCDDTLASVNPGAPEACDGVDNDCDGATDEDTLATWFQDADGDGVGDATITTEACTAPTGWVDVSGDCDDADASAFPGAPETCDGTDDDCDGTVDDDVVSTWYADNDGDGFGDPASPTEACAPPTGFVVDATDCDDTDAATYPGAPETCDGADDDCDGSVDEGVLLTWYADADGDGAGGPTPAEACTAPAGYVATSTDCDDGDSAAYPGAPEVCDGEDDDCDGTVDEGVLSTWYRDADGDGWGSTTSTSACTAPTGYVATSSDCNDASATVNPGATETCDDVDNDCDGAIDETCPEEHCGYISSDEVWEDNGVGHLVTCTVYVSGSANPVLTVEDGATVSFAPDTVMYVGYPSSGDLVVEGTSRGVTFTSAETTPAAGDWYGIYFYAYASADSRVEGLTLEYAGQLGGAIYAYYTAPEIVDSTIRDSSGHGIYSVYATPTVTGTVLEDNAGAGLACYSTPCLDDTPGSFADNVVTGNRTYPVQGIYASEVELLDASTTYAGNGHDVIQVVGGTVQEDATWQALDVPYYLAYDLYVQNSARTPVLTLEDGVEVQFDKNRAFYVGTSYRGDLVTEGTTRGVTLTSSATSPNPGDWSGLYLGYYSNADTVLDGVTVEYGGGGSWGAGLFLYYNSGDSVTITRSTFRENEGTGAYASYYTRPTVTDSTFSDNESVGYFTDTSSDFGGTFSGNTMTGNGTYPLQVNPNQIGWIASDNAFSGNGKDYVLVNSGLVTADTTVRELDVPYEISGDVSVYGSAVPVLTVEAGVEMYFAKNAGLFVGNGSYGDLVVNGTDPSSVLFSTTAGTTPGTWDGLYLGYYSSAASVLQGFTVEYAGTSSYPGGVMLYYARPTLTDCVVRDSKYYGIYDSTSSSLTLRDCEVTGTVKSGSGDGDGVRLAGSIRDWSGNVVTDNDGYPVVIPADEMVELDATSTYTGNGKDSIYVTGYYVGTSGTWSDLGVPFLVGGTYLNVYGSAAMPVEITVDGAEVQFPTGSYALYVGWSGYGDMYAEGATFTSAATTPVAGDWDGLYLGYYTSDSEIRSSTISYGGDETSYPANVVCYYCKATLSGNTITDSEYWGIYATGSYALTSSGNTYARNGSGDSYPSGL